MTPGRKRLAARLAALTLAVSATAACGLDTSSRVSGPATPPPVVVGASATTESELLARLYAGALDASGRRTALALGLGDRTDRIAALDADRVTLVPDRTGQLLHWFDAGAGVTDPDDVFDALGRSLPEGLAVADYAPAGETGTATAQNVVPLYRSNALRADDVRGLSVVKQLTASDLDDMVERIRRGEVSSADAAATWIGDHL